ncbi:MAG: ParB/RepB/Spo0J family partition protein [Verrucomicrobiota bacterium]|jgi:ParB-like chromosome segregation protein Spo0J|nr:ParB/RepB/Spo0J family partition protein [Verrucomicrobiota bacterium]
MLTTKRFDYVAFDLVHLHPSVANHRPLNEAKVAHYADDILHNGLLEPLVVWERNPGEYYLVGGFHRYNAIRRIRSERPGYFDQIDVRVVHGELDEIQALNLKLNADRLDARITDYFDAVIFMSNANWDHARIARFLDKRSAWIEDILRYAPGMDSRVRRLLEKGEISWSKAKALCKAVSAAPPGEERATLDIALAALHAPAAAKPLTFRRAAKKLKQAKGAFTVTGEDIAALLEVVRGRSTDAGALERVRTAFPGLLEK